MKDAGGSVVSNIVVNGSARADGDALKVDGLGGNDVINASAVAVNRVALTLAGGSGDDMVIGSRFDDVLDGGRGNDRYTGGLGRDQFFDASPSASNKTDDDGDGRIDEADENEIDTLVETFNSDIGLYNDTFIVGTLLNSQGTAPFAQGKNTAVELSDAGDRFAGDAIVEDLNNLFEKAELSGGAGNNTFVVNDLDNTVRVGADTRRVANWRGQAMLDNKSNDGLYPEHYLVAVPENASGIVDIADSGSQANDRLVITGTQFADRFSLDTEGPGGNLANSTGNFPALTGTVVASDLATTRITHRNVEFVEDNTREGNDLVDVRAAHTQITINTGDGDDTVNVGNRTGVGGAANFAGLNAINSAVVINGQGTGDKDILDIDDSNDTGANFGTLTASTLRNGVAGSNNLLLMAANGQITYTTFEVMNLTLGSASGGGNVITIESTHSGPSVTNLTSGGGNDVINIETLAGPTNISAGAGSDTVRVGSTTGDVGTIDGLLDPVTSKLNQGNNALIAARLTVTGDTGVADTLKVYDNGDTSAENGELNGHELVGLGMTLGIAYENFDVLKIWLSNGNNGFFIDSTHSGVTVIDIGDEEPETNDVNDVVNIKSISGPTTVDLGERQRRGAGQLRPQRRTDLPERRRQRADAARPAGQRRLRNRPGRQCLRAHQRLRPIER